MKPQRLTILNGRRTSVDYDSRSEEYTNYNRNRWKYDKDVKQFYNSTIWKRTSKQVLLEADYICAMCGGEATMTDHIISVKQDWSKRRNVMIRKQSKRSILIDCVVINRNRYQKANKNRM